MHLPLQVLLGPQKGGIAQENDTAHWYSHEGPKRTMESTPPLSNAEISGLRGQKNAFADRFDTAIGNVRFAAADYRKSTALY